MPKTNAVASKPKMIVNQVYAHNAIIEVGKLASGDFSIYAAISGESEKLPTEKGIPPCDKPSRTIPSLARS
jgi:precorrin-4 methylase